VAVVETIANKRSQWYVRFEGSKSMPVEGGCPAADARSCVWPEKKPEGQSGGHGR
jgi:hypothetical protein